MTPLTEPQAPAWTPYGEWMATPETRRELALHLVDLVLARGDMGDVIADGLAELAGHLAAKERQRRFEVLVVALRVRRDASDVDAAVAALCEGAA